MIKRFIRTIMFLEDEKKDKNELIKSLLMISKYEDMVLSNNNKKPPRT